MRAALNVDLPDAPLSLRREPPPARPGVRLPERSAAGRGPRSGDQISSDGVGRVLSISRAPVERCHPPSDGRGAAGNPPPGRLPRRPPGAGRSEGSLRDVRRRPKASSPAWPPSGARPAKPMTSRRLCASLLSRQRTFPTTPMPASSSSGSAIAAAMKGCTSSRARPRAPISGRPIGTAATSIIRVTFGGRGLPGYVRAGHAAFIAAVVAGDGKTAEQATRHYLVRLGQDVAAVLERQGREERR